MYILKYINLNFQKLCLEVLYASFFGVKYALINFRSPNQYTISIDLLSIRMDQNQDNQHQDKQAKQA